MMEIDLSGKVILLTGASGMLGKKLSLELCNAGAEIILHYNGSDEEMEILIKKLKSANCKYSLVRSDFSKFEDVKLMVNFLNYYKKNVDILINNAAINIEKFIISIDETDFDRTIAINLKAHYFLVKHVLRSMIAKRNGCIVNIASSIIKRSKIKNTLYAASKGGMDAITRSLAREVGCYNIRVNAVSPGPFYSQMNNIDIADIEKIKELNAINRIVTPEEVAKVVLFLCSEHASAVTGQNIFVDNGFSV